MMGLREKIAAIVRRYDPEAEDGLDNPHGLAAEILAIPEIAEALKAKQREETVHRSGNLGHSIRVRDPD